MRDPDRKKTPTGKLQKASPSTIATWISNAWKRIEVHTITKSFKKCSITNNLDGTEDDLLWDTESGGSRSATDSSESDGEEGEGLLDQTVGSLSERVHVVTL